jgi:hypothetical protein
VIQYSTYPIFFALLGKKNAYTLILQIGCCSQVF